MKTVLIIGLGRLGHHLCVNMSQLGNEVMIVDRDEECMQDLLPYATMAKVGDCTNEDVLRSLGVGNFDICFVCIGSNFQSSLEITSLIKEMGAKYVVSKANRDIHAKFLLRNGADEVIYPDRDIAERLAVKHSANHVFDYIELTEGYSIFEIPPMKEWIGKSIRQLAIRSKYHVSILGIKKNGHLQLLPQADRLLDETDHLMVVGLKKDIDRILANID
ncbi:TrkA family potassium uptake protein [Faecalicatena sp. AGMB00832]|uniref:TrkA family potassium uptake protein n=1 Tax=Faecalicatena faecalis TaxID=2726362 RepID=A0ABS6D349_9FIRM|nr:MULTISPECIES: TrkA family potassium uptake protein [Faecalicatena]MBU3876013.1 TrkA family potassium uptake protein [Faecalicatena faecalis]MCI6468243.1 TrkA family potassium uptake protein [Faecalicatena sp.]MDY5620497.1 TrkA family potassium uptake protein [Lachnospiraceae bacterium]